MDQLHPTSTTSAQPLPGMAESTSAKPAAKADVQRWDDEGGKPPMTPAERLCVRRAERRAANAKHLEQIQSLPYEILNAVEAVKAWAKDKPLQAAASAGLIGYIYGRLRRR